MSDYVLWLAWTAIAGAVLEYIASSRRYETEVIAWRARVDARLEALEQWRDWIRAESPKSDGKRRK